MTGVDKSAAMFRVAATFIRDPRATWIQARAESVDQHVTGPVNAVLCNSAIWQTGVTATATAVRGDERPAAGSRSTCGPGVIPQMFRTSFIDHTDLGIMPVIRSLPSGGIMPDHACDRGAVRLDPGASRSHAYQADPDANVSRPSVTSVATLGSLSQAQQRAVTTPAKLPIVRHCASSRSTGNHGP